MPGFFTVKFSLWVISIMGVLMLIGTGVEELRLHDLRVEKREVEGKLTTCTTNLTTSQGNEAVLTAGLAAQGLALDAAQRENKALKAAADARAKEQLAKGKLAKEKSDQLGAGPAVMNQWLKEIFQ